MPVLRIALSPLLVCLLGSGPLLAQQPRTAQRLRIIPLEGQNAVNYIQVGTATAPVVEVRDENDLPVEGAVVEFRLPTTGPGAAFTGGEAVQKTITDMRGQAGAKGYTINDIPGRFRIVISAAYQNRTAQYMMSQTNTMEQLPPELGGPPKGSGRWKWILLGVAAGVGTGLGIYYGTRGDSGPISVGTGPVVIGGPR
jgi:hypothetical protein